MNLSKCVQLTRVKSSVVAGTTAVDSNILDMAGFDGVMFVALLGTVTSGSVLTLVTQQNTANSTSGMATITGASAGVTDTAGEKSNGALIVDVYRPLQRYVRAELTRTTANAVVDGILAIQYAAGHKPTTQDVTTILASTFVVGS